MTEPRKAILDAQEFIPLPMNEPWDDELIDRVIEALGGRERLAAVLRDIARAVAAKSDDSREGAA